MYSNNEKMKNDITKIKVELDSKAIFHIDLNSTRKYLTFSVDGDSDIYKNTRYFNDNMLYLLNMIGKAIFKKDDFSMSDLFSVIANVANQFTKGAGKYKNRDKRISKLQVKTICKSFKKSGKNNANIIRIPFNIVPILYTIFYLYKTQCQYTDDSSLNQLLENKIGEAFYHQHIETYNKHRNTLLQLITDKDEKKRIKRLDDQIELNTSLINIKYFDIEWTVDYYNIHD